MDTKKKIGGQNKVGLLKRKKTGLNPDIGSIIIPIKPL